MEGKFIAFDGVDGCGKTTIARDVVYHIREEMGIPVVFVNDPGGTEIGTKIRHILLDPGNSDMCPETDLLLYLASRAQLLNQKIKPSIEKGSIVVSDRYNLSTYVYQCLIGGWPLEKIQEIENALGMSSVGVDALFLLDLDISDAIPRMKKTADRQEARGLQFLEDVRKRFLQVGTTALHDRLHLIDATPPFDTVKSTVIEQVENLLSKWHFLPTA